MEKGILALAFGADAPKEVQSAADSHRENWLRLEKAKAQLKIWNDELNAAEIAFSQSENTFAKTVNDWDPANTRSPVLEVKS